VTPPARVKAISSNVPTVLDDPAVKNASPAAREWLVNLLERGAWIQIGDPNRKATVRAAVKTEA
jgi:hypothetical protein